MYDTQHFTRDAAIARFDDEAAGITVDDDGNTQFDWDEVERVTISNPPHAEAFDSKEFYKIPATVAKPIPQPYQYGEDTVWLKKPREALKNAAWSLDNAPWTMGHPETGMVKNVDDVHGFWKNPRYIDSLDDLDSDLHIPVGDDEAKSFVEENNDVSVGFYNKIARIDEYDGVVGGEDAEGVDIEGYQTNMLFDHCASVAVGRCSGEAGCGIDSPNHGHITAVDSTHGGGTTSLMSQRGGSEVEERLSEGTVVEWHAFDNVRGVIVHAPEGESFYMVNLLRQEDGEWVDSERTVTAGISDVSPVTEDGETVMMDMDDEAFKRGTRTTHKSDEADGATNFSMQATTDQPSGIKSVDGDWYVVGPDEHTKESTDHPEDHMYPVGDCGDVGDAWRLRGHAEDLTISEETLAQRIVRAAEAQDCENVPDTLQEEMTSDSTDCGCGDNSDKTMEIDFDDLSTEAALAKVASQNDGVDERLSELRKAEERADVAAEAADELELDDVSTLPDKVALLEERNDELQERIDELQRPKMEEDAQYIAEHTDRFGEDADEVIDNLDADPEAVSDKRELVEELASEYDEVTANSDNGVDGGDSSGSSGKYAKTPW
jgi:hypothetical protein